MSIEMNTDPYQQALGRLSNIVKKDNRSEDFNGLLSSTPMRSGLGMSIDVPAIGPSMSDYNKEVALSKAIDAVNIVSADQNQKYRSQYDISTLGNNNYAYSPGSNSKQDYSGPGEDYYKTVSNIESGGKYNAYNEKSGATGTYQFLKSTAEPYLKKYNATWEDFKKNPLIQEKVMRDFTNQNMRTLKKLGLPVNNFTLWVAHNQGIGGVKGIFGKGKISTKNLAANLPASVKPTIGNYVSHWSKIFS